MAEKTAIEWADATWNPWIGCTKVSPACDHCYAERDFDLRRHVVQWGAGQARKRTGDDNWKKPGQWNKRPFYACACGYRGEKTKPWREIGICCPRCEGRLYPTRRRVFCASLADVFDNEVPVEWLVDLLDLIRSTPNLDWLLLTKRIGNWKARIEAVIREIDGDDPCELRSWLWSWINDSPTANVWLGATICNQAEADRDIPKLLATPARVRFLSIEPMLAPIDLKLMQYEDSNERDEDGRIIANTRRRGLHWVICGGESGPSPRPMHPEWARSLRDQCAAAGVPFLFKQWGEWMPAGSDDGWYRNHHTSLPLLARAERGWTDDPLLAVDDDWMACVGKKSAGRLLDGVEHNGFPGAAT
jgi:protein gp37